MSAPENHPAFPQNEFNAYTADRSGMTLRDWFAGQALAMVKTTDMIGTAIDTASAAYAVADAMLAERAKQ